MKEQNLSNTVRAWVEPVVMPTYEPGVPDKNPMFLEKRVYQGSSGKVYPLPFIDRVSHERTDKSWQAVHIENEFLYVMVLPEIGGRIHIGRDKTNGYDFFYRQNVIKPALVGLAGPWVSGGVEFNWPQHHRPATFMPVEFEIEEHEDGSRTIWCSDHDPMARLKGMHGICLHPGKAYLELKARIYNRTPFTQTFLWWANVGVHVHEGYQSFFPPDAKYVADHAKRAMSEYPLCRGFYYGVNYGERARSGMPPEEVPSSFVPSHCRKTENGAAHADEGSHAKIPNYAPNDLSWYANIPTPCSYMCMGSKEDFVGGYDHLAQAGLIHVANHHIAPGKKQWTWGNHAFGYAWDRNLTDSDGPYIELMAGVYTDNQPDFSFLHTGESRTWSQFWYPIQKIGPAQHANLNAAVSLCCSDGKAKNARIGVSVSTKFTGATVALLAKDRVIAEFKCDLAPGNSFVNKVKLPNGAGETDLVLRVTAADGGEIISYRPKRSKTGIVPAPATEPKLPHEMSSADELYVTGLHLDQYRHATRCPTAYWREALRRDPLDYRCNNALGLWHLRRGEFVVSEKHFRSAIERLTSRNPNPADSEAYYNLGLCLRFQLKAMPDLNSQVSDPKYENAYAAFYKATWNQAWAAAAYHALAEMDCQRKNWQTALDHLDRSLRFNTENLRARTLKALVLRKQGCSEQAARLLHENLRLDPLDAWTRVVLHSGDEDRKALTDTEREALLDVALDFAKAGFFEDAIALLANRHSNFPTMLYALGFFSQQINECESAARFYRAASQASPDYCFPSRLEEMIILQLAVRHNPRDARAHYYLGNFLYDKRRHTEAIRHWQISARLDGSFSIVWRNLGIGYFNISKKPARAKAAYARALAANPCDGRLLYEFDQLLKRLNESPAKRLARLEKHFDLVRQRDDLSVEFAALCNQTGQSARALAYLQEHRFQPWEGGEGLALGQYVRAQVSLGRVALQQGDACKALQHLQAALTPPLNLGEVRHLLANQSDVWFWLGEAYAALSDAAARQWWQKAAEFRGDFQQMSVKAFSEMTFFKAKALARIGRKSESRRLLRELLAHARKLHQIEAKIDYFATSLPTMLLFDEDLQERQQITATFLQAQAQWGLGRKTEAAKLLRRILAADANHALAADLLTEIKPGANTH